jgi:hypothetical protein
LKEVQEILKFFPDTDLLNTSIYWNYGEAGHYPDEHFIKTPELNNLLSLADTFEHYANRNQRYGIKTMQNMPALFYKNQLAGKNTRNI